MSSLITPPELTSASVERDLDGAREAVLRRDPDALARAADVQQRAARVAARANLIAALAASEVDGDTAAAQLDDAIAAAAALPSSDAETMLDLALALLVAERSTDAVDVLLQGLRVGAAYAVTPAQLMAFIDQLLGDRRGEEAEELLRAVYDRLIERPEQAPVGPDPRGPRPGPKSRRKFLKEALRLVDERLETREDDPTLLSVRAGTLIGLGRLDEAVGTVWKVLNAHPRDELARDLLVAALTRQRSYGPAVKELQELPPERLQEPQAVSTQVDLLVRLGTPDEAVEVAEQAVGRSSTDVDVGAAHVRALSAADRNEDARALAEQLVAAHPGRADLLVLLGDVLRASKDDAGALAALRQAVGLDPGSAIAHAGLARALEDQGNVEEALYELDLALHLDPGRSDLMLRQARMLLDRGRAVAALEVIEGADVASFPEATTLRGEILTVLERYDEALTWLLRAFDSAPDAGSAASVAEKVERVCDDLFQQFAYHDAFRGLEYLRDHGAALSPRAMTLRAELLRLDRRPRAALAQAEQAANAGFDETWLFGTWAQALIELGRADEALHLIQPILETESDYAFGQSVYLDALLDLGRLTQALADLETSFPRDDPPAGWHVWAMMARGQLLVHSGRHRDAMLVMQEALLESPSEQDWLATLGMAKARLFEYSQAIDAFQQALELSAGDVPTWALLDLADAIVAHEGHRTAEATELYERVAGTTSSETPSEPPSPQLKLDAAWAHLRLEQPEEAITQSEEGLEESSNPLLGARLRLSAAFALAGRDDKADAELDAVMKVVAEMDDRAAAAGVVADSRYAFKLLEADPVWKDSHERLAQMRQRLSVKE